MGCCEVNGIRQKLDEINPFKNRGLSRDKSAPICRKPIFEEPYRSGTQYYSYKTQQFKVSRSPQQPRSCPPQKINYISNQSFSVPVSKVIQQPQYVIPQYQYYPTNSIVSFRGDYVNQMVTNLNNQQQRLFKSASKAILNVSNEKLTQQDKQVMQDVFQKLEKSSCMNSRRSSKCKESSRSVNMNSKELKKMYDEMSTQLSLLNKLITCLDDKWNMEDSKRIKIELKEFADKVKQLGEVTLHNSIADSQENQSSVLMAQNCTFNKVLNFSNMSEQEETQIQQMKDIMQKYHVQNENDNILSQKNMNKQSFISQTSQSSYSKQSHSMKSSQKMKENNTRMDQLIVKLQHLNKSYKQLGEE